MPRLRMDGVGDSRDCGDGGDDGNDCIEMPTTPTICRSRRNPPPGGGRSKDGISPFAISLYGGRSGLPYPQEGCGKLVDAATANRL